MVMTFLQKPRKPLRRTPFKRKATVKKRKTTKAAKKRSRNGIWSTKTADMYFSRYIRERDGKCLRCGTRENLTCSHYWKRGDSGTRFDPNNCIALCAGPYSNQCHETWEKAKNLEYKQFMIRWLGQEEYDAVERRARTYKERREAVAECRALLTREDI
jgi:hypothetical protein